MRRLLVGVGLAVLLLALVLRGLDWAALWSAFRSANAPLLLGVALVTVVAYWMRALRWGAMLAPLVHVRHADLFSATMVGFTSSFIVPRSGELLRPWLISRRYTVSTAAGFATIIVERVVDLITVLALFAIYLFIAPLPVPQASRGLMDALTLGGAVAGCVALALLALMLALHANAERVTAMFQRLLVRAPPWLAQPLGRVLRSFPDGLAVLRASAPHLGLIGVQSIALWLLTALGFGLTQMAFGIDLPFRTTLLLLAFLVVGESIPTPGHVGGFHAFYVLALVDVYGVDRAAAAAAAIAAHALTNLPVLLLGIALLGREGLNVRRMLKATTEAKSTPSS